MDIRKIVKAKRVGFARGERKTKAGITWEREALYHEPHKELGINYSHYGVTYRPQRREKRELHILIKKD